MGIYDRDWYKEAYKQKEEKYGSDFSSNGKKQSTSARQERPRQKTEDKQSGRTSEKEQARFTGSSGASSQQNQSANHGFAFSVFPNNPIPAPFGDDLSNRNNIIGLGICPQCFGMFRIRTPKYALFEYSYSCPNCGTRITVKSDRKKPKGSRIAKRIFYGIGIVCICLIVFVFALGFLVKMFPEVQEWVRNLLDSIS